MAILPSDVLSVSVNKYLLSINYVPGTLLGTEGLKKYISKSTLLTTLLLSHQSKSLSLLLCLPTGYSQRSNQTEPVRYYYFLPQTLQQLPFHPE